MCDLQQLIRFW